MEAVTDGIDDGMEDGVNERLGRVDGMSLTDGIVSEGMAEGRIEGREVTEGASDTEGTRVGSPDGSMDVVGTNIVGTVEIDGVEEGAGDGAGLVVGATERLGLTDSEGDEDAKGVGFTETEGETEGWSLGELVVSNTTSVTVRVVANVLSKKRCSPTRSRRARMYSTFALAVLEPDVYVTIPRKVRVPKRRRRRPRTVGSWTISNPTKPTSPLARK